jgi:hypothetical protein
MNDPGAGLAGAEAATLLTRSFLSTRYHTGNNIQTGCDIFASHGSYVF